MSDGPTIWDLDAARDARDEAITNVSVTSVPWRTVAYEALLAVAAAQDTVTSDDVWKELERRDIPRPPEGRAMGPVMMQGVRDEVITPDGYTQGADPRHHADVMRVYRALRREAA